jgi:hypothetical protein
LKRHNVCLQVKSATVHLVLLLRPCHAATEVLVQPVPTQLLVASCCTFPNDKDSWGLYLDSQLPTHLQAACNWTLLLELAAFCTPEGVPPASGQWHQHRLHRRVYLSIVVLQRSSCSAQSCSERIVKACVFIIYKQGNNLNPLQTSFALISVICSD